MLPEYYHKKGNVFRLYFAFSWYRTWLVRTDKSPVATLKRLEYYLLFAPVQVYFSKKFPVLLLMQRYFRYGSSLPERECIHQSSVQNAILKLKQRQHHDTPNRG